MELSVHRFFNPLIFSHMKTLNKSVLNNYIDQKMGESDWLKIDQSMINEFANVTKDHQFIHVDPDRAKDSPFKGTIAHGFLSLSMLSHFAENGFGFAIEGYPVALNYGFDKIRFVTPVKVDSKIRGRSTLRSVSEKIEGQILVKQRAVIDIKDAPKPALIADWLTMYVAQ